MSEMIMIKCTAEQTKKTKALLKLYRNVLHNVNNHIVYLDDTVYTTSRKHLADFVGSLVDFEPNIDSRDFNNKLESFYGSLSLLELIDKAAALVYAYPDHGIEYYEILRLYYLSGVKYTHDEIIEELEMSRSNYFRYFDQAIACFRCHFMSVLKAKNYELHDELLLKKSS
jgi:hypothetical protein